MALKNLVVMGCSFSATSSAGTLGGAVCTAQSAATQAVKADNKFAYFGSLTVGITATSITTPGGIGTGVTGTITINGSAENVFSPAGTGPAHTGAQPALLEGDYGDGTITCTFTPTGSTTPVPGTTFPCRITISGAGQSKVTAS